jgi:hypothetical protein
MPSFFFFFFALANGEFSIGDLDDSLGGANNALVSDAGSSADANPFLTSVLASIGANFADADGGQASALHAMDEDEDGENGFINDADAADQLDQMHDGFGGAFLQELDSPHEADYSAAGGTAAVNAEEESIAIPTRGGGASNKKLKTTVAAASGALTQAAKGSVAARPPTPREADLQRGAAAMDRGVAELETQIQGLQQALNNTLSNIPLNDFLVAAAALAAMQPASSGGGANPLSSLALLGLPSPTIGNGSALGSVAPMVPSVPQPNAAHKLLMASPKPPSSSFVDGVGSPLVNAPGGGTISDAASASHPMEENDLSIFFGSPSPMPADEMHS